MVSGALAAAQNERVPHIIQVHDLVTWSSHKATLSRFGLTDRQGNQAALEVVKDLAQRAERLATHINRLRNSFFPVRVVPAQDNVTFANAVQSHFSIGQTCHVKNLRRCSYHMRSAGTAKQLLVSNSVKATMTDQSSFTSRFFASLLARLTQWFADAQSGITDFFARRGHFEEELCLGETCVTPEQFAEVFGNSQSAEAAGTPGDESGAGTPSGSSTSGPPNTDTATTTTHVTKEEDAERPRTGRSRSAGRLCAGGRRWR
jgi:hypothetical protein